MRGRRRVRRDGNHAEIAGAFKQLGCSVADMAAAGDGFPDLVVGCMGVNRLVEVKDPTTRYGRAGLSESQRRFNEEWRGEPMVAVSTIDEAAELVAQWRKQ